MIPNLQIPNWDPTQPDGVFSVNAVDTPNVLNRYDSDTLHTLAAEDFDAPIHLFSSDHFRMFQFKIRNCTRARSHDWTECPYAHPGEKARRRDPRKYHYSCTACPEYRKGNCNRGDTCQFAHGVFECWLHPSRYRTQICKDGIGCRRRVCFFAHTMDQLRVLTRGSSDSFVISSPTSVLNADSPPPSPGYGAVSFGVREIMSSLRNVHIEDGLCLGSAQTGRVFGSPGGRFLSPAHRDEDPILERVESGRDIRARMYARLSRENSIGQSNSTHSGPLPDIGWVTELLVTHP